VTGFIEITSAMALDAAAIEQLSRGGETLRVEFKSERREPLSDREIYENAVCLANTAGGVLLIGVENDGTVTGARPRHGATTDAARLLAETFRRLGFVETTGRGIDKIYLGQLWYGRPLPDYSQSDREQVRLILRGEPASVDFAALVFERDRAGSPFSLDELLALNYLLHQRRVTVEHVGKATQRGAEHARVVLERLVERGLVAATGGARRSYHASAAFYRRLGAHARYVPAHGYDPVRQEAMILQYVQAHGRITRGVAAELCHLGGDQASRLLRRLARENKLKQVGVRRGSYYELPEGGE
jgi:ATP-dependent DNA helicase RecG